MIEYTFEIREGDEVRIYRTTAPDDIQALNKLREQGWDISESLERNQTITLISAIDAE